MINLLGILIALLGESFRSLAVGFSREGTSGRETYLRADDLNTDGLYSIMRNPLYVGNVTIYNGLLVVYANIWALLIFNIFIISQYYFIILSEENYLESMYGEPYLAYKKNTRRVIPGFKKIRLPRGRFNWRKVIVKENTSFFNLMLMFIIILLFKELQFNQGVLHSKIFYIIAFVFLLLIHLLIKFQKKRWRTT